MKVIGLTDNRIDKGNEFPGVYLMADSSLIKDGKPFFVPDFSGDIKYKSAMVIRISRLGKNIAKKFAHRYYDAVTLGLTAVANDMKNNLSEQGLPVSLALSFDGSAVLGNFVAVETAVKDNMPLQCNFSLNGVEVEKYTSDIMKNQFDSVIEYLSKYYTLKIGDLIFMGTGDVEIPINIDDEIHGNMNGDNVLTIRIK